MKRQLAIAVTFIGLLLLIVLSVPWVGWLLVQYFVWCDKILGQ